MKKGIRSQLRDMGVNVGTYVYKEKVYISLYCPDSFRVKNQEKAIREYVTSQLDDEILL